MLVRDYNLVVRRKLGRVVGIDNHEMTRLEYSYNMISWYLELEGDTNPFLAGRCSGEEDDPTAQCVRGTNRLSSKTRMSWCSCSCHGPGI